MSLSEIGRFVTDLKSNTALRAEAAKEPGASSPMSVADVVSFSASNGYSFTVEEASKFVAAVKARIDDKRLTDAELDGVAAAGELEDFMASINPPSFVTDHLNDALASLSAPIIQGFAPLVVVGDPLDGDHDGLVSVDIQSLLNKDP